MAEQSNRSRTLRTVPVSPLAMARETVLNAVANLRQTIALAQHVAASVRTVELVSDDLQVSYVPEVIDGRGLVCVPVGGQAIGLRAGLSVAREGNSMLLGLRMNAHLLERLSLNPVGSLIAQASCRLHTQVRVVLAETIDVEPLPSCTQRAPAQPARE